LRVPIDEGERLIAELYGRLLRFADHALTRTECEYLAQAQNIPVGYQSLLAILAAEAARRRSWFDLMNRLEELCTNAQLRQVWGLWKRDRVLPAETV
jgi:hypothetical protein